MRYNRLRSVVALWGVLGASAALACPNCATSRVVKAAVLEGDFWRVLLTVLLPFLAIGFLSALLYRVGLPSSPRGAPRTGVRS